MAVGETVESFDINDISSIQFGAAAAPAASAKPATAASKAATAEPALRQRAEIMRPEPNASPSARPAAPAASASRRPIEVPLGTSLVVRMIDDVDSERDQVGQTFRASLDEAVVVEGETVVPRGADVVVKLIDDKQSGKLTGRTELTLDIQSIAVNGKMVDVMTQEVTQASQSRTTTTGRNVGGGAALGAIIGAIAGGGKGAAIGAVTGAAAGGAVQVITKGQTVKIPSETRLTFTLQQPVRL
jgi:hypothetical protein